MLVKGRQGLVPHDLEGLLSLSYVCGGVSWMGLSLYLFALQ